MTIRIIVAAAAAFLLSGCLATLDGKLENRVTTTLACDRAFFASLYGPFGLTSEIDKKDLAALPCARAGGASATATPGAPAASAPVKPASAGAAAPAAASGAK